VLAAARPLPTPAANATPDGQADVSALRQLLQRNAGIKQQPLKPKNSKSIDSAKSAFGRLSPKKL
jgi:hypothetical protein